MLARVAAPLVCLAVLLTTGGCSDDESSGEPSGPTTSAHASSSSSPSPTQPVEPTPPAAMDKDNVAGAKAFVRYFWEVVEYAQKTGDVSTLETLYTDTCETCSAAVSALGKGRQGIKSSTGGRILIDRLEVTPLRAEKVRVYQVAFSYATTRETAHFENDRSKTYPAVEAKYQFVVGKQGGDDWRIGTWEALS